MNLNNFLISGHITRDLELRHLPNGTATVTYTVASNLVRYDDAGKKHERADFIPVTTFGKQAERDSQFLRKGSSVTVEGRIESWFNPEEKRGGFYFKARNVEYGSRGNAGDAGSDTNGGSGTPPRQGGAGSIANIEGNEAPGGDWLREYEAAERTVAARAH